MAKMTIEEIKTQECQQIINEVSERSGVYVLEARNENRYHYIAFVYEGYLFYIQASAYYPFIDENYPSEWVYMVSEITGINEKSQISYFEAYKGFDSLKINRPHARPLTKGQKINVLMNNAEYACKRIIAKEASARELEIIRKGAFMAKGETWNDDHKVIEILATKADLDGYFPGFQIDLVTETICG